MNSDGAAKKKNVSSCYEVIIQKDKCKGCQLCIEYCPTRYLELSSSLNKRGVTFAKVAKNSNCIGCGFCFIICPETCIEVYEKNSQEK